MSTISELINAAKVDLQANDVDDARRCAQILLSSLLNCNHAYLIAHSRDIVEPAIVIQFGQMIKRRVQGEPLQYILGVQEFFGRDFIVNPAVLIPRPETELIIEAVLALVKDRSSQWPNLRILDICTGSGCIAVTLAAELPQAHITALDISPAALAVAKANSLKHNTLERMDLLASDLCNGLQCSVDASYQFQICTANPPYIDWAEKPTLSREVREHEPALALFAQEEGLTIIKRILNEAAPLIAKDGYLFCEIGYNHGSIIPSIVPAQYWQLIDIAKDLQQIPRTLILRKI